MKLLNLVVLIILLPAGIVYSQNLTPNPSFEDYVDCPTGYSAIDSCMGTISVTDWYIPTGGSADYLNSCATFASLVSVPSNFFGYQYARTGEAYAGCILYTSMTCVPNYREYVEARLLAPMVAGHRYHVSYWLSLGNRSLYAIDQIGAFFSPDSINDPSTTANISATPQVVSPASVLHNDTAAWQPLAGEFTAAGENDGRSSVILCRMLI